MLSAAKASSRTLTPAFEPLLDLHEAATVLGMHWKTLEGKAPRASDCGSSDGGPVWRKEPRH